MRLSYVSHANPGLTKGSPMKQKIYGNNAIVVESTSNAQVFTIPSHEVRSRQHPSIPRGKTDPHLSVRVEPTLHVLIQKKSAGDMSAEHSSAMIQD